MVTKGSMIGGGSATLNFRRRDSESAVIFLDSKIPSEIPYDSC